MNQTGEGRPRRIGALVAVAAATLTLDVTSKVVVVAALSDRPPIRLLGGLLTLRELRNSGAAFNIGTGMTLVFTLIATGVVVAILRYARQLRSVPWAITLGLLLGGALGNLTDRMLRAPGPFRGHVVDWIELPHWPVFNLADSAIVCGGALAVLLAYRGLQVDGTVQREDKAQREDRAQREDTAEREDTVRRENTAEREDTVRRENTAERESTVRREGEPPGDAGGDGSDGPASRDAGR